MIVVDDDASIPALIDSFLKISVVHFRDPEKLLSDSRNLDPKCIFLDIHLDDGKVGLNYIKSLKQRFRNSALIVITSDENDDFITASFEAGADDYINKPLRMSKAPSYLDSQKRAIFFSFVHSFVCLFVCLFVLSFRFMQGTWLALW